MVIENKIAASQTSMIFGVIKKANNINSKYTPKRMVLLDLGKRKYILV